MLTHRPDLWGHHGMAREVAAITKSLCAIRSDLKLVPHDRRHPVPIEDLNLCPRYSALVFENVTVQPSPLWLQYRLDSVGLNPINNIVDLTNYMMAELAQPMHAFDAKKLQGDNLCPPRARRRTIMALNDEEYALDAIEPGDRRPLPADRDRRGHRRTRQRHRSRDHAIVLESANFNAASVRKTSVALKLRTDASMRFEKSQDPHNTVRAASRVASTCCANLAGYSPGGWGGRRDATKSPPPEPIALHLDWLASKLGRAVEPSEVASILDFARFRRDAGGVGILWVTVPTWRAAKDVTVRDDLVEEVGRMLGYDSVTPRPPMVACAPPPPNPSRAIEHGVRQILADEGFTEVSNYSFVTEEEVRRLSLNPDDHVRVANPIVADQQLLRSTLLPGILRNIETNNRNFPAFRWFEIGNEIHKREGSLPDEKAHVVAALFSRDGDGVANLLELKRVAECLMRGCVVEPAPRASVRTSPARG